MGMKLRVFVSSTMKDLANERLAVVQRLSDFNFEPVNVEGWRPDGAMSWPRIQREIESSDLFVLILGERYGWVPDIGPGAGTGLSVTHLEYERARKLHIPVLPFLKQLNYESDRSSDDARSRDAFRQEVRNWAEGQLVAEFELAPDLAIKVGQSIIEFLVHSVRSQGVIARSVSLVNHQSEIEREVLRVLAASQDEYLRRVDIYKRLDPKKQPTLARVGQILVELHSDNLLKRIHGRAKGSQYASFYALSPRGIEVCQELGLNSHMTSQETGEVKQADLRGIFEMVDVALDPKQSDSYRGLALGTLASCYIQGKPVIEILTTAASERNGGEMRDLFKNAIQKITLTRIGTKAMKENQGGVDLSSRQSWLSEVIATAFIDSAPLSRDILSAREEAIVELLASQMEKRPAINEPPRVLIIEDQIGDILWLIDLIHNRGYKAVFATNEEAARKLLEAVSRSQESYALAIVDVAVATKDLKDLLSLDDQFFENSLSTGIRLCRYARQELGLPPDRLPIACFTVRDDEEVKRAMEELQIPLFNRFPRSDSESIRGFIEDRLPVHTVGMDHTEAGDQ